MFFGLFAGMFGKLIAAIVKSLRPVALVAVVASILYMILKQFFGFVAQYWQIGLACIVVIVFIGPEIERLRYSMQRNHSGFLTQTRGASPTIQSDNDELWDSYYTD